jgi:predicted secreted protein
MNWFTAVVLFVLVWWTILFAVLPFGTRPVADADAVTGWRGAPTKPMMGRKLIATTLISLVVWGAIMLLIYSGWISFRSGWLALPEH